MPERNWLSAVTHLRDAREPGVLVTLAAARGHAPRAAGAKLVVGATQAWGSIGGGNMEAVAIDRARALLTAGGATPELITLSLSDKAPYEHGVQCCGGVVTVLLEPLPVVPAVALFGVGHVGLELARVLARHDIDLHLIDTRPEQLADDRLAVLADAVAQVHIHRVAVLPEIVLGELPAGTHVLIMTHDHAEDFALCDAVLRGGDFGSVGLIGSAGKWARFRAKLAAQGHDATAFTRVTTPIGLADIRGKEPATIAVSVAADLLCRIEQARTAVGVPASVDAER
ncbi:xanthine dehydrogenase accessory protein XdhC [Micromonospora sp. KC606]|uniref:xanthine dehydrogenase accessory protein XdhC n=1 Tax=Micromonospora sp. KC606 TaxID=2530379 RepID=UPI00104AC7B9|nr:xanthine dehydrogenase accessory protein XdhC [Micromonospora sp. KC606]TDC85036.1 xanthine dehydrogenase accessory protein XdhC [Micromonospora sp. KC606]